MKKTRLDEMKEQIALKFDKEEGDRIIRSIEEEYNLLCRDHLEEKDTMENHKKNNIFPVVATCNALEKNGMTREEASELAQKAFLNIMEPIAESIRKMMKIPGAYRLMPWLWKVLMPKLFSEESGFRFSFYPTSGKQVKFDMLQCPYLKICTELDCLDLAPVFCTTDDVCYGHMHPKLIWNRTKTLAKDGESCDFDLYIP